MTDEDRRTALDRVAAGLVDGLFARAAPVELRVRQPAETHRTGAQTQLDTVSAHQRHRRVHLVRTPRQTAQHRAGRGRAVRLAEDLAVESHRRIGPKHRAALSLGELVPEGPRLGLGEAGDVGRSRLARAACLVDLDGAYLVDDADLTQQLTASRRRGSQKDQWLGHPRRIPAGRPADEPGAVSRALRPGDTATP